MFKLTLLKNNEISAFKMQTIINVKKANYNN